MTVEIPGPGPLDKLLPPTDLAPRQGIGASDKEWPEGSPLPRCVDCGAIATGHYCPECGQETELETPTVGHFVREFIDQFVAIEGRMGRTLRVLLTKPGQLTADYVAGRRQRYVRPLKFYLSVSVVFFSIFSFLPDSGPRKGNDLIQVNSDAGKLTGADGKPLTDPEAIRAAEKKEIAKTFKEGLHVPVSAASVAEDGHWTDNLKEDAADRAADFAGLPAAERSRVMHEKLADTAPYAMFFLMPYLALLLKWFYRANKRLYGEHLLFALHLHTFGFILLAVGFIPWPFKFSDVFLLAMGFYVFIALRRFYGGGWKRTLWRLGWLYAFYGIAFVATAISGVMTAVFGGHSA